MLQRPNHQRPMRENDLDKALVRIILQCMNLETCSEFALCITDNYAPDIQIKIYDFVKALICSWAGEENLSCEDAAVIEDCRKIRDMMGWPV